MERKRCYKLLFALIMMLGGMFAFSTSAMANTRANATKVSIPDTVSGTLSENEPVIWYKFEIPCTGVVRFELDTKCRITSFMLTKAEYSDSKCIEVVHQYHDKSPLGENTISEKVKKGIYYLKVNSSAEGLGFRNLYGNFNYEVTFRPTEFTYGNINYKITGEKSVMATGLKDKYVQSVKIPEMAKIPELNRSYKVTSVSDKAFKGNVFIKNVVISKYVKKIGKQSFYNCKKLQKVIFNTKTEIKKQTFKGVNKKIKYKYPKKYQYYYKVVL